MPEARQRVRLPSLSGVFERKFGTVGARRGQKLWEKKKSLDGVQRAKREHVARDECQREMHRVRGRDPGVGDARLCVFSMSKQSCFLMGLHSVGAGRVTARNCQTVFFFYFVILFGDKNWGFQLN